MSDKSTVYFARLKELYGAKNNRELAEKLGINHSTFRSMVASNKVPWGQLVESLAISDLVYVVKGVRALDASDMVGFAGKISAKALVDELHSVFKQDTKVGELLFLLASTQISIGKMLSSPKMMGDEKIVDSNLRGLIAVLISDLEQALKEIGKK